MADTVSTTAAAATAISATEGSREAREDWARALDDHNDALAHRDRYYEENRAGLEGSDHRHHEAIAAALSIVHSQAEDTLFATPAPDLGALVIKIERAFHDDNAGRDQTPEEREVFIADMRRLIPGTPALGTH